jgi:coatomer subunit zeta
MVDIVGSIIGIIVLDNEGKRLLAKYYGGIFNSVEEEKDFERKLYQKSNKLAYSRTTDPEILNIEKYVGVFRFYLDLSIYIIGNSNDNELVYATALDTIHNCLEPVFKEGIERKHIMDNMSSFLIIIDELIDNGVITTLSTEDILSQVATKNKSYFGEGLSFAGVFAKAKKQIAKSFGTPNP